jgi:signal peptidase I
MASRKKLLVLAISLISIISVFFVVTLSFGQGSKFYVVFSESMIPSINTGDIVIVAKEDQETISSFNNLKIGDVIVFEPRVSTKPDNEPDRMIVHRVVAIETDPNGTRLIKAKGDANPNSIPGVDFPITIENYIGRVTQVIHHLGVLLMYVDLIARVLVHPIFYGILGSIIGIILVLEIRKRQIFLRSLNE